MNNLSDFHIHIDYFKNYNQIFHSFNKNKIYALFVTNLPEIFQQCRKEFPDSKYVKLALGYNPQLANKYKFNQSLFDDLLPFTKYVGEVGLDYSKEFLASKNDQQVAFEYICFQSAKLNRIMSIHSRKAESDVLSILINNNVKFAVLHWYSGNKRILQKAVNQGYYFSVNYSMLSTQKGFDIIRSIPLDRLLIETDAPFGNTNVNGKHYDLPGIYNKFSKKLDIDSFEIIIHQNLRRLLEEQGNVLY
ncbi:TatD family hydrolase [Oceanobacillus sp. 1P07AA]|uniref:TatD family hydrolase n=1 Tax=Oceanobacillus sp. 1P07AA TaxID=3132293 RepID=UPI0039A4E634